MVFLMVKSSLPASYCALSCVPITTPSALSAQCAAHSTAFGAMRLPPQTGYLSVPTYSYEWLKSKSIQNIRAHYVVYYGSKKMYRIQVYNNLFNRIKYLPFYKWWPWKDTCRVGSLPFRQWFVVGSCWYWYSHPHRSSFQFQQESAPSVEHVRQGWWQIYIVQNTGAWCMFSFLFHQLFGIVWMVQLSDEVRGGKYKLNLIFRKLFNLSPFINSWVCNAGKRPRMVLWEMGVPLSSIAQISWTEATSENCRIFSKIENKLPNKNIVYFCIFSVVSTLFPSFCH